MGSVNKKKFKIFIFDLISFGSSQAIAINIILIFFILFFLPTSNLSYVPLHSIYGGFIIPYVFNNSCPAEGIFKNCGFYSIGQTRGLSSLLHGDLSMALEYNRLSLILLIFLFVVLFFNLYKSYVFYKKTGKVFPW